MTRFLNTQYHKMLYFLLYAMKCISFQTIWLVVLHQDQILSTRWRQRGGGTAARARGGIGTAALQGFQVTSDYAGFLSDCHFITEVKNLDLSDFGQFVSGTEAERARVTLRRCMSSTKWDLKGLPQRCPTAASVHRLKLSQVRCENWSCDFQGLFGSCLVHVRK